MAAITQPNQSLYQQVLDKFQIKETSFLDVSRARDNHDFVSIV